MANLTNSNKLIGKFAQIDSDISNIKESLPADGVGEGVVSLGINDEGIGSFNVNQKNNSSINFVINRNTVGLGNVNNTSDMDKPVSTAQQAALDLKADKVDTYTKVEVDDLLSGIAGLEIRKVDQLPDEGENGVIYLVPSTSAQDTYDEYIWVASDSAFEKIGNTNIDLSNYYNKDEVDNLLDNKADKSEIPTKTSDLTNDSDFITSADLPTVNDARITVQKNSESVDSFTLNQNTDNIINITNDKTDVGLDKVDNTSDADKPISDATQAALDLKADKTELPTVNNASVTVKQGTSTKGTFTLNQAGDVTIELDGGGDGDVKYSDFEFVIMESEVIENLTSMYELTSDAILTAGTNLKEGMQYLVRVQNSDTVPHTVTFDCFSYEIEAGGQRDLVFFASDNQTLEFQSSESGGGSGPSVTVGDGNITVQNQYGEKLGSFSVNQTEDTVITINESTATGDMKYQDFNFVTGTGATVALNDFNVNITPDADFTVTKGSTIKDGQVYILRVTNEGTPVTMTLGNGITNPFNVDLTLTEDGVDQFVFLATENVLELQPQLLTKADVEQILRDHGLIP